MERDKLDNDWHLVLWHRARILEIVQTTSQRCKTQLRFDRAALIDAYAETRDVRRLAQKFGVTVSAINDALSRLVRFARQVEDETLVAQFETEREFVVLVAAETRADAAKLQATLESLGFDATVIHRR
jgi:hypothetical protein